MIPALLTPLLTTLFSNGLNLLGNAVMAKGQAVVEEKLGVKLDDMAQSDEGRIKLAQIQAEREEDLQAFVLAQRQQELDADKMAYADTDSARDMNTKVNESVNASWLSKNIAPILALMVVIGGGAMLALSTEPDVRTAAVGLVTLVLGFYFGSTQSSRRKDETISALTLGNDK